MASVTIDVTSAGYAVGNTASFRVNGTPVSMTSGRGLNVIVLDPSDGTVVRTEIFDTYLWTQQSDAFASLVEDLPIGYLVGIAVQDEAAWQLTDRARRACETLGSVQIYNLGYRGSWGMVGQKGAPLGTALEMLDNAGMVQFSAQQALPDATQRAYRVRLWSAGFLVGNTFFIEYDGKRLALEGGGRGLNVAVIDAQTCQVLAQHTYDTYDSSQAADQFAQLVDDLPLGQFVAVAVQDEATWHLTDRARGALALLGAQFAEQLQYRNSYALFGQKGAIPGSAAESLSATSPVLCESWVTPRPLGWQGFAVSTLCATSSQETRCATFVDGVPVTHMPMDAHGLALTVIDEVSGVMLQSSHFDPVHDATASDALAGLIQSLPMGRVVVISAMPGALAPLGESALQACSLIGSAQVRNAQNLSGSCWCIIGRKGAAPGAAPECFGDCRTGLQYWFLPGTPGRRRYFADVQVRSAGHDVGNLASIAVNGSELGTWQRGMNVAVFDEATGVVLRTATFDTYASPQAVEQFSALLEGLPTGRIVAIAVKDEAIASLTERARQACESIGSAHIRQLAYRGSWAIVGIKGAAIGSVAEALGVSQQTARVGFQLFTRAARQAPGVSVLASSQGSSAGNAASISVNGQRVDLAYGRGLNVAVIDRKTGRVTDRQNFDTYDSVSAADAFAALVEQLPFGSLVAVAVMDEATSHLTDRAKRALRMLGSGGVFQLGYHNSWAMVGMKGSGAGSAFESLSASGPVCAELWVPLDTRTTGTLRAVGLIGFLVLALVVLVVAVVVEVILFATMAPSATPDTPTNKPPTPPPPPPTPTKRKALLVALDYTDTALALGTYGTNALGDFQRALINANYFTTDQVMVLTDEKDKKAVSLSNVKATLMNTLVKDARPGDVLCFYFFGHGASIRNSSGSRNECIIVMNDAGTSTDRLYDVDLAAIIAPLPTQTNLTLVYNSCHSGGMADYVPYPPKRGITLAAVPYNLTTFFSGSFSQYLVRRLNKYSRNKEVPIYKPLVDEVTDDMKKLGGITSNQLPVLLCDASLYDVTKLQFLQSLPPR